MGGQPDLLAACRSCGTTARHAARRSVATTAPPRYASGRASHRYRAVHSDQSPRAIATTYRVRASRATHAGNVRAHRALADHYERKGDAAAAAAHRRRPRTPAASPVPPTRNS